MNDPNQFSQIILKLSSADLKSDINLKPEDWRVLTMVNGVRSLGEIAQSLGMDPTQVMNIANSALQAHILELAPGSLPLPGATVEAAFFDEIANELAHAMGPLAAVIIEDEIAALGENRETFPRDRLADLVERVSAAIKDNERRLKFQRVMLEAIRHS
jgi:hypothetical protein